MEDPGNNHPPAPERLKILDGLRAFAIFLVVAHHVLYTMYIEDPGRILPFIESSSIAMFIINGWVGVHLFFVLSGFLIAGQLIPIQAQEPGARREQILHYLKKRFFRVAPLYYLVTTVLLVLAIIRTLPQSIDHPLWWAWEYMKHILFLNDYAVSNLGYVLWSLAVEIKFYLIAPLLVWSAAKLSLPQKYKAFILTLTTLLLIKFITLFFSGDVQDALDFFVRIRSPFHMALDSLIVGMICQFLWVEENIRALIKQKWVTRGLLVVGTSLFLYLTAFTGPYFLNPVEDITLFAKTFYFTLISLAFGCLLLAALASAGKCRFLENRVMGGIAIISYSFYLIHAFLTIPSLHFVGNLIGYSQPIPILWAAIFFVLVVSITPVSVLLYYFVEKPFINWSKKKQSPVILGQ